MVESLQLARDVAELGADAIVATTPYYLPLEEAELVEYVRMLDKESPLPVVLYNMPRLTKQPFSLETLRAAMQFEKVVGVKDSSGDMDYFKKLCDLAAERPDWSLLIGSESMLADAIKMGADGGVTGGANVAPALLVDVYESATNGDDERVKELQQSLRELGSHLPIRRVCGRHDSRDQVCARTDGHLQRSHGGPAPHVRRVAAEVRRTTAR